MIKKVVNLTEKLKSELIEISEYIFNNPELGYEEYKACKVHMDLLKRHGFTVEEKYMNFKTAFKAVFDSGRKGPTIAYLSEYDALPQIGHGCGHNILGVVSSGAGIILSKLISDLGGKVIVFGTPAEEIGGAKVKMAANGAFNDVDVAMEAHPAGNYYKSGSFLAMESIKFIYKGKSAHAASEPEKGINALDAAINTFNNINALRQHIASDARIHGIITEGGKAPNIVPELAVTEFYVRAAKKSYVKELVKKVEDCAKGAALGAGAKLEIINDEVPYYDMITNKTLSDIYCKMSNGMGVEEINEPKQGYGSSDVGNVSYVCPAIHPYFKISDKDVVAHTVEFAEATCRPTAYEGMCKAIGTLVLTGVEIIKNEDLLNKIKEEFNKNSLTI
ncbi:M20 family metallopeptidase [Clostridium aestuarii]|uniref:Peptidase M20 domain-containing protein 2 n=1 Tax=Clostridium aestuarii TaxID=338193 RepID=A0ABT4CV55_9CLOT|nr:M20 family metallopeptidase [Clostridium aestuarii]MCY6482868.1 M20 family metallopeptidase [Clostridium aestuarii]